MAMHELLPPAVSDLWDPGLLSVHAVTDALIGLSCVTIVATLGYVALRARRDIAVPWIFVAFGAFILAGGIMQLAELYALWVPRHWLSAGVKVVAAIAAVTTAVALPPLVPRALSLVQAARASHERDRHLRRSEAHFRGLLECAPDALVIADERGRIVLVNQRAEAMFGYRRDELLEQPVEVLLPEALRHRHARHQEDYRAAPHIRPMGTGLELSARRKDGREFPAEISLSPLQLEEGLVVISVIRDITDRKKAEEQRAALIRERAAAESARHEAEAARAIAEAASRTKDEFLAMVSHELRTPLTSILGWARILRVAEHELPPSVHRPIAIIERNAKAQAQLIDDLLDVSRIVAGRLKLEIRPVDLSEVIETAVDIVRPAAEAKALSLTVELGSAGIVLGDFRRLQQVVWNLLSNAVKFTDAPGHVSVRLSEAEGRATIAVTDSGVGIATEFLPDVFAAFRQADARPTRKYGGLGLGLAIARELVELHGGSVSAASEGQGRGATFTVTLPLMRQASMPSADEAVERPRALREPARRTQPRPLDGARVLIVDDDPDTRELVASILARAGAATTTVGSAREALGLLEGADVDVIVADIGMPDVDGYSLMRRIRALPAPRVAGVPAVALTAYARPEDRQYALAAGFQRHLAKPVDPSQLTEAVGRLLGDAAS